MPTHPKKADVALPTLAPLAAPLAALSKDEMRERQRLHVKRTYYRKLNVLQTLRDEMLQLEKQYDGLLAKKRAAESGASLGDNQFSEPALYESLIHPLPHHHTSNNLYQQHHPQYQHNPANHNPQSLASLRDLYTEISQVKERLRAQNEAMAAAVTEYNRFSQKLKSWIELDELNSSSSGDEVHAASDDPLAAKAASYTPRLTAPITVDVCHEVARSTYADMQRFRRTNAFLSTGVSIFGWRDKRVRKGDRVKFSLKKIFHGISPLELSMRGWPVLASAKRLPTLYSTSIDMKMTTLQRVDDDNEVMLRVMTSADGRVQVKSLFVVSRFQIPDGYAILVHSIDRSFLAPYKLPPGVMEQWIDYYTWITFEHFGENGEHCVLDFGGEVQSNPVLGSDMWMLEVLLIALRWEAQVYGPIFSIC